MNVWEGTEKNPIELPVVDLIDKSGSLVIDPDLVRFFDVDHKRGRLVLRAKGHIGQFKINDENLIVLRPGIPSPLVTRIVSSCSDGNHVVLPSEEVNDGSREGFDIIRYVIYQFAFKLKEQRKFGLWRRYRTEVHDGPGIEGCLNISETARAKWCVGKPHETISEYEDLRADIDENKLIKLAIRQAIRSLRAETPADSMVPFLRGILLEFSSVPNIESHQVSDALRSVRFKVPRIPPNRVLYKSLIQLASWIIEARRYEAQSEGSKMAGTVPAIAFDMADFYERYVRKILKEELRGELIDIHDGRSKSGRGRLFVDHSKFAVQPDLVFRKKGSKWPFLIGDVKYKPKVSESDRYQVITHAKAYGANYAVVIRPALKGRTEVLFKGTIGRSDPIVYCEIAFLAKSSELQDEELHLVDLIRGFISEIGVSLERVETNK